MIKTEKEYRSTLERIVQGRELVAKQRQELEGKDLSPEEIERVLAPLLTFYRQYDEEVQWYERVKSGDVGSIDNLTHIGHVLIGLRLARNLTQKALAERLGVSEAVVSRDESNGYHGISIEKAQRILDALEGETTLIVAKPRHKTAGTALHELATI
jgi:DNA-directed RNA polymerase specialized sigma subunit